MRNISSSFVALGLAAGLVLVTSVAHATVVIPLSLAEQTQRADLVVRATVGAQRSAFVPERGAILTWSTLQVREVIKGQASDTLTLRQMGGVANGMHQLVPGDAHLTQGDDVVLFLRREGDTVFLFALAQSCYFVDPARGTVQRDLSGLTFAQLGGGGTQLSAPPFQPAMRVEMLISEIRALAGGAQ